MLKTRQHVTFTVNGRKLDIDSAPSDMHLAHFLREELGFTGTRVGCSIGECRACTVMVRHSPGEVPVTKQACMVSLRHVHGWDVTTIEGLNDGDRLHSVQEAILAEDALQCGYCAAGFAVAAAVACAQMEANPEQDAERVVEAVTGHNLCRCTGYGRYRRAILKEVKARTVDAPAGARPLKVPMRLSIPEERKAQLQYSPLFDEPKIELLRLLRDAAEIEHSLLVQYLYAAFSVKIPQYSSLAGWPSHRYGGRPLHLLGVAIEEMFHLDLVNHLLVELKASPHLGRQQFPYEHDIYPFPFMLEPLGLPSLAKYVYVEAGADAIDPAKQVSDDDKKFVAKLDAVLATIGADFRPNHVGSLYRKIDEVIVQLSQREPKLLDYDCWRTRLGQVMIEGETEHYQLFRSIFDGSHPALGDAGAAVWDNDSELRPSMPLRIASGIPPAGQAVPNELLPALRHLGNLHYWTVCLLLHQSYVRGGRFHNAARRHMTGPLRSLAQELGRHGEGMPFDVLPTGYAPGANNHENLLLVKAFLVEIGFAEGRFASFLPVDYATRCALETAQEVDASTFK